MKKLYELFSYIAVFMVGAYLGAVKCGVYVPLYKIIMMSVFALFFYLNHKINPDNESK